MSTFPKAGRNRNDVRPGLRTITFKKRTLVAYHVDDSSEHLVVNVIGIFHGGQNWEGALAADEGRLAATLPPYPETEQP